MQFNVHRVAQWKNKLYCYESVYSPIRGSETGRTIIAGTEALVVSSDASLSLVIMARHHQQQQQQQQQQDWLTDWLADQAASETTVCLTQRLSDAGRWWRPSAQLHSTYSSLPRQAATARPSTWSGRPTLHPDVSIRLQLNLSKILIPIASGVVRRQRRFC